MFWQCDRHGATPRMRYVSASLYAAVERRDDAEALPVIVEYPDLGTCGMTFLDREDLAVVGTYLALRCGDRCAWPPVLVFHDRARKQLNDKVFILKFTKRLRSICAACLRDHLSRFGRRTDMDIEPTRPSDGLGWEFSPKVLSRLGLAPAERNS